MSWAEPIIVETRFDPASAAAAQAWGRRSIFPLWMRLFGFVWGLVLGGLAGAGMLVLSRLAFYHIDPQMTSRAWLVFPVFVLAGVMLLWARYQRFHLVRLAVPRGDMAERYRFDADGFSATADGAERRVSWWRVDDMGSKGGDMFIREGSVLHPISQAGDAAQIAAIRSLWLAGRAR